MEKIDLEELADYEEDKGGLHDLERPYLLPSLLGLGITLGGFVLMIAEVQASHYNASQPLRLPERSWFAFERIMREAHIPPALHSYIPILVFAGGLAILFTSMAFMAAATPVSRFSHDKMEKYWNAYPAPGNKEIVYVDRASRTYFKRIFVEVRRAPSGYQ